MTNEEAIKSLKEVHDMYDVMFGDWSFCNVAIEALEKQILKKPKTIQKFADLKLGVCPVCGSGCNSEYNYCLNEDCLQRLDWSDE